MRPRAAVLVVLLAASNARCGGPAARIRREAAQGHLRAALRAYDGYVLERGDGNPELLADLALTAIRRAAGSDDQATRAAGFSALRGLGAYGRDTLEALASRSGVVGDRAVAELYELEGRSGAPPARLAAARASDDPERRLAGLSGLRGRGDAPALLRMLGDPELAVRRVVTRRLGQLRGHSAALAALVRLARTSSEPSLRATAVMSLAGFGPEASEALVAALNDPDSLVRMAAPSALATASPEAAREALLPMLSGEPTELSVEVARVLASRRVPRAADYVVAALGDPRPSLRVQAAVAAGALGEDHAPALARHLTDPNPEVSLRVAAALVRRQRHREQAEGVLRRLGAVPDAFVAIRALAALAAAGDRDVSEAIRGALGSTDATVRRLAVLAWGDVAAGSGNCDPLAPLLVDRDRSVALLAAVQVIHVALR